MQMSCLKFKHNIWAGPKWDTPEVVGRVSVLYVFMHRRRKSHGVMYSAQQNRCQGGRGVGVCVLLCFIDPRVRKIRNEASSCPGIFSRTLHFYYVASSPGSPLPHLLDGHRKLVGRSAIPARSCPRPVMYESRVFMKVVKN